MKDLTFASATSLASAIRGKEVSSREVIDAHLEQIARENPRLNAVVRVLADSARAAAAKADQAIARGDAAGPFHGVPMSVKDAWEVAGVPSTGGTLGRANYIPEREATVIARMRAAGAIPIGMTNLPELSMAFESDNLVHGRANNPYNVARTPGGSGGGGAAAIAAGMSPIEIGADLGGSVRLPSHFCGIAGIRATTGRAPMTGYFPPMFGWTSLFTAAGPMARTVQDLAAALPVISGPDWIDARIEDVPLRDSRAVSIKGLRVAVHTNNGIMAPTAETKATVLTAAKALADAGAVVEEATPTGIEQCIEIFIGIANADAGENIKGLLAAIGTKETHPLLGPLLGPHLEPRPAAFLQQMLARADMYRSAMLGFLQNYDLILCPTNALPAIKHGEYLNGDMMLAFSYTIAYNLTGWPGAVVRCRTSPEGLPIGVQSVARPWREDVALAVAQHLEAALGGYQRPPLAATA
ncbi:MAG TPA: amidase [Bryobacteraceae bacterium]|nr:amidase [Bryobacteraceae bacterium]